MDVEAVATVLLIWVDNTEESVEIAVFDKFVDFVELLVSGSEALFEFSRGSPDRSTGTRNLSNSSKDDAALVGELVYVGVGALEPSPLFEEVDWSFLNVDLICDLALEQ